jgi:hypothetical protein
MNSLATTHGKLAPIDFVLSVMDSPQRPLDFGLLFHLREAPGLEALRVGATSSRNLYPTTGSHIDKKHWVRVQEPGDGVSAVSVSSDAGVTELVEEFLDHSFDPGRQLPVQQLVIANDRNSQVKLVTRFHHAVADGLSAAMWLRHQLRVAYGKEDPVADAYPFQELPLRNHQAPAKKSRFAYRGASHRLWSSRNTPSGTRRWRTIRLNAAELRDDCRRARGFTYNDLLATCALEVFTRWNHLHGDQRKPKIGLWLPVNIRQQSAAGFGNGCGRIRLYARYGDQIPLLEKCREIRRQVSWSTQHGEWAVPQEAPFEFLPRWISAPLVRLYLNRPGVDMASSVFSHAERWSGEGGDIFQNVEKIESIGQLHASYCVALNAATHMGQTWLTFTYDPALLTSDDIAHFVDMYQEQVELAKKELR